METKAVIQGLIDFFNTDQWAELMRQLTQTDEELYHSHLFVKNTVHVDSLSQLFEGYFRAKGIPLDRRIDILHTGPNTLAVHNVHPHNPDRTLYTPHFDMFFQYEAGVVIKPSNPAEFGEGGKNIDTWGKSYMNEYYKQFDFKCVGPNEEREIQKWFDSRHWKKGLEFIVSPLYDHVHLDVEISFDPWILKVLAIDALKKIGWTVDHVIPCVFKGAEGKYQGKMVFLGAYPEEVYDIAWSYNPDVVIQPATFAFAGVLPEDGDIAFDICSRQKRDELLERDDYTRLTMDQIAQVLNQVV